ncbi:uncharacterized protein LOC129601084 [Paramacrobiotus metropolitanus]|uniref:uncharacterized protein LOC129601084 n=1 Tax=Paramacrobiotus metropolitanus TaxID=2943436 RepID=UPI002446435C|nr:uncharacterized protein LOC129601084 [Paramacrobiotus metropolitanus]
MTSNPIHSRGQLALCIWISGCILSLVGAASTDPELKNEGVSCQFAGNLCGWTATPEKTWKNSSTPLTAFSVSPIGELSLNILPTPGENEWMIAVTNSATAAELLSEPISLSSHHTLSFDVVQQDKNGSLELHLVPVDGSPPILIHTTGYQWTWYTIPNTLVNLQPRDGLFRLRFSVQVQGYGLWAGLANIVLIKADDESHVTTISVDTTSAPLLTSTIAAPATCAIGWGTTPITARCRRGVVEMDTTDFQTSDAVEAVFAGDSTYPCRTHLRNLHLWLLRTAGVATSRSSQPQPTVVTCAKGQVAFSERDPDAAESPHLIFRTASVDFKCRSLFVQFLQRMASIK